MLQDTEPQKEKALIEEKLTKVTTEKAPVANGSSGGGSGPVGLSQRQSAIAQALGGSRNLENLFGGGGTRSERAEPAAGAASGSGAAAAAGVLTAIDEDEEGGEEAPVPGDFEYFTEDDE